MDSTVLFAFGLTLFAGLSTGIGAACAVIWRNPGPKFLAGALGFSAGVMLYVSFMEILPEGINQFEEKYSTTQANWYAVLGFFAGIVLIALIDRMVPTRINPHEPGNTEDAQRRSAMMQMGVVTAIAIAIHNFPEGFATFLAGLADPSVAIPVAVAIAIHNIPEGIAVAVPIREATGSRAKGFWWGFFSGLAEPLGAVLGYLLLMSVLGPLALGIAFVAVAGIMVFISIDELLPTAIDTGEHHVAVYGLVAGMAVMALSLLLFM
ncbi:MAG: zinc transporter ZupT [Corynebacterium sp.]|nr:zinc transporter ZupT [Corynebacterium sp.]